MNEELDQIDRDINQINCNTLTNDSYTAHIDTFQTYYEQFIADGQAGENPTLISAVRKTDAPLVWRTLPMPSLEATER